MIRIAFYNFHDELNRDNYLFTHNNVKIGDDLLLPFIALREFAESKGIHVATTDCISVKDADAIVFIDMPDIKHPVFCSAAKLGKPLYLIVLESRIIRPENYDVRRLELFRKVFTYDDSVVDGKKFHKLNYAFALPGKIDAADKQKLCVMIAGNKKGTHLQELYSERKKVIRWFEKYHPEDFDLYGIGWDKYKPGSMKPRHYLNPFRVVKMLCHRPFTSFRGSVERKRPVLAKYRFAICYENVAGIPGYITEKIFDSFFAGTVPVYLGADNIQEHIPPSCFIDKRNFSNYQDLYAYMLGMDDVSYDVYLEAIRSYVGGTASEEFSIRNFVHVIDEHVFSQF